MLISEPQTCHQAGPSTQGVILTCVPTACSAAVAALGDGRNTFLPQQTVTGKGRPTGECYAMCTALQASKQRARAVNYASLVCSRAIDVLSTLRQQALIDG